MKAWAYGLCAAVGFAIGWVVADGWVRGRLENDAGATHLIWPG